MKVTHRAQRLVKIVFALAAASAQASEIVCLAFALGPLMSALGQKRTSETGAQNVRFTPNSGPRVR